MHFVVHCQKVREIREITWKVIEIRETTWRIIEIYVRQHEK